MKLLIMIFALILLVPSVMSQESIYSGTIETDKNLTVEGKIFRFSYDEPSKKIFAQNPSLNLIISLYECKLNSFYKICVSSANFTRKDTKTYRNYYDLNVQIYEFDYGVKIASNSTGQMLQNELKEFSFEVRNPTTIEATGFSLSSNLSGFIVKNVKGCDFDGITISLKGNLAPYFYRKCSMDLSLPDSGSFSIAADISYVLGFQKITSKKTLAQIEVLNDQLIMTPSASTEMETGSQFHLNITLQNLNPNDADVTARIGIPKGAYFTKDKPASFDSSSGYIRESFVLRSNNSKAYEFLMRSDKELQEPFDLQFTYRINGIENTVSNLTFIKVIEPKPQIDMIVDPIRASPGQKITVVAKVTNPSKIFDFKDLEAQISSKTQSQVSSRLPLLRPNESQVILSSSVLLPNQLSSPYSLDVEIKYSLNGYSKTAKKSTAIEVINGTIIPDIQQPSNVQDGESGPGEIHFGNDAESQLNSKTENEAVSQEAASSLAGLALVLSSIENMNSFQKIVLIFGSIMIISVLTIFTVLTKLKSKRKNEQNSTINQPKREF